MLIHFASAAEESASNRDKRFFQNFQSYFSKSSTTASPAEPQRNVRILSPSKDLCGSSQNCTEAKFVSYDASTPVPYLTPPTRELDKSFGNDFGQKYAPNNGYTYDSHVNFQSTFQNGSGDFFMANDKSTFHLLPFSTETEPDLLNVKLKGKCFHFEQKQEWKLDGRYIIV